MTAVTHPTAIRLIIAGHPAPQGSKRAFRNKHTGTIQQTESSPKVEPWRQDIRAAIAQQHPTAHLAGPIAIDLTFAFARPKAHYRTGRNAHLRRPQAPAYPGGRKDDLDKLARAALDAIASTGLIDDDGQVARLTARKLYTDHPDALDRPGARITIRPLEPTAGAA